MDDDLIYANVTSESNNTQQLSELELKDKPPEQINESIINNLIEQIKHLNEQSDRKSQQISELNSSLLKQTDFCQNLTDLLRKSEEKNEILEANLEKSQAKINSLQNENSKRISFFFFKNFK